MEKINRETYQDMITQDIRAVNSYLPGQSLEKTHIVSILTWSVEALYADFPSPANAVLETLGWVDIQKRKPESYDAVLFTDGKELYKGFYANGEFIESPTDDTSEKGLGIDVIPFWMPAPVIPKKKEGVISSFIKKTLNKS